MIKENYKEIYLFIINYLAEKGEVPTLQQIGDEFKFSRENARQMISRMIKLGYLIPRKIHQRRYFPLVVVDIIKGRLN